MNTISSQMVEKTMTMDPKIKDLIALVKSKKYQDVVDILIQVSPHITAILLVQGAQEKQISLNDANIIANLLSGEFFAQANNFGYVSTCMLHERQMSAGK